jgi:hypothetical protein
MKQEILFYEIIVQLNPLPNPDGIEFNSLTALVNAAFATLTVSIKCLLLIGALCTTHQPGQFTK